MRERVASVRRGRPQVKMSWAAIRSEALKSQHTRRSAPKNEDFKLGQEFHRSPDQPAGLPVRTDPVPVSLPERSRSDRGSLPVPKTAFTIQQ